MPAADYRGDELAERLRRSGVATAERELATAQQALDDLTPAQRRIVADMAHRIAAGVLDPVRTADDEVVAELFDSAESASPESEPGF
jgi:hypothetical protein